MPITEFFYTWVLGNKSFYQHDCQYSFCSVSISETNRGGKIMENNKKQYPKGTVNRR